MNDGSIWTEGGQGHQHRHNVKDSVQKHTLSVAISGLCTEAAGGTANELFGVGMENG